MSYEEERKRKQEMYNRIMQSTNSTQNIAFSGSNDDEKKRKQEMYTRIMNNQQPPRTQKYSINDLGQYGYGNIDLTNRPIVKNSDGSISTVRSMSFNEDGKEILVPTVVNGKVVSDDEAIQHYHKTGEYLGKFDTIEEADKYAEQLHLQQQKLYANNNSSNLSEKEKNIKKIAEYITKNAATGTVGGITGLGSAVTSEVQNNLNKGEKKGFWQNAGELAGSFAAAPIKTATAPFRAMKKAGEIVTDSNKNVLQKAGALVTEMPNEAINNLPFKDQFNKSMQLIGGLAPEASEKVNEIDKLINKPHEYMQQKTQEEAENYDKGVQLLGNAANSIGNMLPSVAVSAYDPALGLATMGVSTKGQATQEALKRGADLDTAIKSGNVKGITEVGTEMLTGGVNIFGKGALDDIVEKGVMKKVKSNVGKFLLKQGYDFGGEIGEEVISDVVGTLVDKGTVDPNATYSISDLGETTASTILTTAVLKALGVPVNQLNKHISKKQTQNNVETQKNIAKNDNISNLLPEQVNNENNNSQQQSIQTQNESGLNQNLEGPKNENVVENDNSEQNLKNKAQRYINKSKSQFINDLVSDLQTSRYSNKELLNSSIEEIMNEINTNGKVSNERANEIFENLYSNLQKTDSDYYEQYYNLKQDLKNTKIFVPDNVKSSIVDFNDFGKRNRGNLTLTNDSNNIGIDTKYKELSEQYPELFPETIINPADQLERISEVARDIKKTETNVQAYLDSTMGPEYKMWAKEDFNKILDKFQNNVKLAYEYNADTIQKSKISIDKTELKAMYDSLPMLKRQYEKVMNNEVLTTKDRVQVDRLLKDEITPNELPNGVNKQGIMNVYKARQQLNTIQESIKEHRKNIKEQRIERAKQLLGDLSKWKDKKIGWLYSRETTSRNIYDVAPKETANAIVKEYVEPYHINEAESIRLQNKYADEISELKLSNSKKYKATFSIQEMLDGELKDIVKERKVSEAELVQIFGEGRITLEQLQKTGVDTQKIIKSVETFRKIYNELFDLVNNVLLENGLEPVQKRANYFPHFTENEPDGLLAKAAKIAGIDLSGEMLPTDIAGKTQNFKPNKKFVGNFLQRNTNITDFNALKGFDNYIKGVTDVIYHTEDIMKYRALSDSIRSFYNTNEIQNRIQNIEESTELTPEEKLTKINEIHEQTREKSNLSNFITWLDNYINILAGKKSINDRASEKELSRKMYKAMSKIESRIGANMVGGNIGVSLTNISPMAQATAEIPIPDLAKGLYGSMIANGKSVIGKRDTSFAEKSNLLTRRRGTENVHKTLFDKITKPLDIVSSAVDDVVSEGIVRAKYIQNLKSGMTEQEALHQADIYAANLMADRSKGAMPTQFYSTNPLAKMVNMFQVEVNNQYSHYFKDIPRDIKEKNNYNKAKVVANLTYSYAKLMVGSYFINELISKARGNATRVLPDPIYLAKELIRGLGNDDDDDDWETIMGTTKEVLGNTPFASVPLALFGSAFGLDGENIGRVSIAGAVPDVNKLGQALFSDSDSEYKKETVKKELEKPLYNMVLPVAGSQVKKTVQGAKALIEGGSYTTSKNGEKKLQFEVDRKNPKDVAKTLLFGKWSAEDAQNYDQNPLTEKQQIEMKNLGISAKEYRSYRNDLKSINKIESDKTADGKSISGSATGKKAYSIMNNDKYSNVEKEFLIGALNSEDTTYRVKTSDLKKLGNSEENYKYFYSLSAEKKKEFLTDLNEYKFNAIQLVQYNKELKNINEKYEKEKKQIKGAYDNGKYNNDDTIKELNAQLNKKKKEEIGNKIINSNYSDEQKLYLYSKSYKNEDVELAQKLNIKADEFIKFDGQEFESDYNWKGKAISNSKQRKIVEYVNNLKLSVPEKAILIKSKSLSFKQYDNQIIQYIDKQDLSIKERETLLKDLGFTVKKGVVY